MFYNLFLTSYTPDIFVWMFRNSARSVSSPFRDYVCSSCLVRNHVPPPIRQQAVRFVSAGVAQADTGTTASDAVLCSTIAAEPGKANEGGGAPAEESTPAVENAKKDALKPETEDAGAPKEKARGRKKKETAKEADASPKIRLYKAREKQPPKPVRPRRVSGSEKTSKESTTKFVKNLKSLRAAKAESPSAAPAENEGSSGRKKVGARRPLEADSLEAKDLEVTRKCSHLVFFFFRFTPNWLKRWIRNCPKYLSSRMAWTEFYSSKNPFFMMSLSFSV